MTCTVNDKYLFYFFFHSIFVNVAISSPASHTPPPLYDIISNDMTTSSQLFSSSIALMINAHEIDQKKMRVFISIYLKTKNPIFGWDPHSLYTYFDSTRRNWPRIKEPPPHPHISGGQRSAHELIFSIVFLPVLFKVESAVLCVIYTRKLPDWTGLFTAAARLLFQHHHNTWPPI